MANNKIKAYTYGDTIEKGRLLYFEPNSIGLQPPKIISTVGGKEVYVDSNSGRRDNEVYEPEDYDVYVDLSVIIPTRDSGSLYGNDILGRKKISIINGTKGQLTDSFINASYSEIKGQKTSDAENLGIESIHISIDSHMYPQVTITFIDVRGFSLMMPAMKQNNDDTYTALFNSIFKFPYPRFELTVKGYYGTPVVYDLAVNEFTSSLNSSTGNYEITVNFIGYPFGLLSDVPMNFIIAAPYIESDDSGAVLGYWNSARSTRLRYTDKGSTDSKPEVSGMELMTFIDYIKATDDINNKIKENGDANAISDFNSSANDLDRIKELKALYGSFISALSMVQGYSKTAYTYTLPKNFSTEKQGVKVVEAITGACSNITDKYSTEWGKCPLSQLFKKDNKGNLVLKSVDDINTLINNGVFENKDAATFKANCEKFETELKDSEVTKEEETNAAREILNQRIPQMLKNALGFEPFVLNYFRMAYGHFDTFFHYFYETINHITSNKSMRIPIKMGLTYENSDLSKKTSLNNGFVPPFPSIFDEDGKLIYPGSDSRFVNMEEVDLVEKILSAALKVKRKTNQYIIEAATKTDGNGGAGNLGFLPSSLFDIFWGDKNPYTTALSLEGGYYLFALRTMISRLTFDGANKAVAMNPVAIEAYNYYLANPNPTEDAKIQIKAIMNDARRNLLKSDFMDICSVLRLGTEVKPGASDNFVGKIYCSDVDGQKWPVYTYDPPFFYNSIGRQQANLGNILKLDSPLSVNITDFEGYRPKLVYVIDNSVSNGNLRAAIEAVKGGILGAASSAKSAYIERLSYNARQASGDPNTTVDLSDSNFIMGMNGITGEINNRITTEKGEIFYLFLTNKKKEDVDGRLDIDTCCYPTDIITDGNTKRPRMRWKQTGDGDNVLPTMLEGDYLTIDILKKIDENIDNYAFPRNAAATKSMTITTEKITKQYIISLKKEDAIKKAKVVLLSTCIDENSIFGNFSAICEKNQIAIIPKIAILYLGLFGEEKKKSKENTVEIDEDLLNSAKEYTKNWAESSECEYLFSLIKDSIKKKDDMLLFNADTGNKLLKLYFEPCYLFYGARRSATDMTDTKIKPKGTAITMIKEGSKTEYRFNKALFYNFFTNLAELYGLFTKEDEDKENAVSKAAADKEKEVSSMLNDDYRLSIYLTLKKIYDKWCPSYDPEEFKLPSPEVAYELEKANTLTLNHKDNFFTDTIYVDSMFNRIGTELEINPRLVYDIIMKQLDGSNNFSFLEFISQICQTNKMLFFSVPEKMPLNATDVVKMFLPSVISETPKKRNTYIAMYPHDVSHFVTNSESAKWGFEDDGLDLQMVTSNSAPVDLTNLFAKDYGIFTYRVPTFAVTYAKQNQSYFNEINVNMDAPRVTDFSIANVFELGNLNKYGAANTPQTVAQDMYAIYSNRSYNCDVTMLGSMNIMPMMYFQLNNVPMFRGAYMITRVEHDIRNNHISTTFMGTRVSKYLMPYNKEVFNFSLFKDFFNMRARTAVPFKGGTGSGGGLGNDAGTVNVTGNAEEKIKEAVSWCLTHFTYTQEAFTRFSKEQLILFFLIVTRVEHAGKMEEEYVAPKNESNDTGTYIAPYEIKKEYAIKDLKKVKPITPEAEKIKEKGVYNLYAVTAAGLYMFANMYSVLKKNIFDKSEWCNKTNDELILMCAAWNKGPTGFVNVMKKAKVTVRNCGSALVQSLVPQTYNYIIGAGLIGEYYGLINKWPYTTEYRKEGSSSGYWVVKYALEHLVKR